jgi:hypothetical protein
MSETNTRIMPTAIPPTGEELAAWRKLSRDEQIARYREALQAPDTQALSKASMGDVLRSAWQRVAARRG